MSLVIKGQLEPFPSLEISPSPGHHQSAVYHRAAMESSQDYGQDWGGKELIEEPYSWSPESYLSQEPWSRQSVEEPAAERQFLTDSPLLVAVLVSAVIVAAQLLPLVLLQTDPLGQLRQISPGRENKLENHPMCGVTTGGQVQD